MCSTTWLISSSVAGSFDATATSAAGATTATSFDAAAVRAAPAGSSNVFILDAYVRSHAPSAPSNHSPFSLRLLSFVSVPTIQFVCIITTFFGFGFPPNPSTYHRPFRNLSDGNHSSFIPSGFLGSSPFSSICSFPICFLCFSTSVPHSLIVCCVGFRNRKPPQGSFSFCPFPSSYVTMSALGWFFSTYATGSEYQIWSVSHKKIFDFCFSRSRIKTVRLCISS
mmetsp:Transcript_66657/g.138962  ORF Transcript_66657/g.138962 Transcript_66657/m.138962 type:complete len:224 (+) Transcript_66657:671-1342(+)